MHVTRPALVWGMPQVTSRSLNTVVVVGVTQMKYILLIVYAIDLLYIHVVDHEPS